MLKSSFLMVMIIHIITGSLNAQNTVKGKITDSKTLQPVPFANIIVDGTNTGTTSDINGNFELKDVPYGYIKLAVSCIGYSVKLTEDIYVTRDRVNFMEIKLDPTTLNLTEVEVRGSQFVKKEESPVSLQTIGIREIERSPGGNRDISKVIQSLPGVASTPSFRNDIIIRGGAPSENKFYLDGIEIPVINHFQTQGSSGGPVGIINVNFIREVDFYSGAFPASRGDALSSVLEFKQIEGNREKHGLRFTLGSSEAGLTADGPLSDKTTYIFSVRRSYLQFLFAAFKLPFLPTFNDVQFKVRHRFDDKNEISIIGIGGYDQFELNNDVNDGITDEETLERNNYILGNIPTNEQWNYTSGINYKHYGSKISSSLVISRNELNNSSFKFLNNDDSNPLFQILDYNSRETENKIRYEGLINNENTRYTFGVSLENGNYTLDGFSNRTTSGGAVKVNFLSDLSILKYGIFASASRPLFKNRLLVSAGFRADGSDYSNQMNNPLSQFSPRISASWSFNEKWSLNANTGRYFQLPAYTILGYGTENNKLINKANRIKYINADHIVSGIQFNPDPSSKITIEGFYKKYSNYPYSTADSLSLANLGSDFGVIGNEEVTSTSEGRAYGMEFLIQRRSSEGLYGIMAVTLVRSEFTGSTNDFIPSAWDNKLLVTITGGKKLNKNWEAGFRWRFVSGRPYTPYNLEASALKSNWDVAGRGINDNSKLNSERLPAFHQLDLRVDKTWFFKKWTVNLYLDIQNVYNFKAKEKDILNVRRDESGQLLTDPFDNNKYQTYFIKDETGTVLPTLGIIIDF
jgi:hypothetical protein